MRWWLNWFLYRDVTQSYWSSRYVFLLKQINIRHDISACWSTENNNKKKKNKFSIKWSKKPIIIGSPWNIAMHVIHLVPSFFISMSMIIILFVIRKDVPLYFHFTSTLPQSKQNNNIGHHCCSYCPQGNISPKKNTSRNSFTTYILSYWI